MDQSHNILLIEDDEDLRRTLTEQLTFHEAAIIPHAATGMAGLKAAKDGSYDLIILDMSLPDVDGREICRKIRAANVSTPIIMLSSSNGKSDALLGPDIGASDYVKKPIKFGVLLARVRAQLAKIK